jgi:hypothetical protein
MPRPIASVPFPYFDRAAPTLTAEDCATLGLPTSGGGETRAKTETVGMWQVVVGVRAIVKDAKARRYLPPRKGSIRSQETDPAIRVSIGGRKVRGFLSSQLFTLPDGSLHNADVIYV